MGNTESMKRHEPSLVGWTGRTIRELRRIGRRRKTAGLRNAGVCAKGTKKESNTLDVADFVRDVANRGWLLKKPVFLRKVENRVIENVQETEKNRL